MLKTIRYINFTTACFLFLNGSMVKAQSSSYEELQAAYLFNFAKYVKWPLEGETFVIGIYGEPGIIAFFQKTLEGKKVRGKAIELRIIDSVLKVDDVNILYVPDTSSKKFNAVVRAAAGKSILIVTEDDMIKKGATISFVVEDDKLRFKLKKNVLAQAGLVASDGLLKLAIQL